jgi:DNA-binding NarL/FixJ family response regulator
MEPVFYLENDENDFLLMDLGFRKVGAKNFIRWFQRSAELKAALLKSSDDQLPKLLLVDLRLNGEYGLDVIEWLGTQDERLKEIPAFIISSGQIGREIVATLEKHAAGYVFKPSSLEGWLELARQFKSIVVDGGQRSPPNWSNRLDFVARA